MLFIPRFEGLKLCAWGFLLQVLNLKIWMNMVPYDVQSTFFSSVSGVSLQPGVDPPGLGLTHESTGRKGDLDVHGPYRIAVAFESECIKLSSHKFNQRILIYIP